jgi:hypothetical protein
MTERESRKLCGKGGDGSIVILHMLCSVLHSFGLET